MDEELYKFHEQNIHFEIRFLQYESVAWVLNDSWLNVEPYWTQMSKKCHFEKSHSKVIPIEWSNAAEKQHCIKVCFENNALLHT